MPRAEDRALSGNFHVAEATLRMDRVFLMPKDQAPWNAPVKKIARS